MAAKLRSDSGFWAGLMGVCCRVVVCGVVHPGAFLAWYVPYYVYPNIATALYVPQPVLVECVPPRVVWTFCSRVEVRITISLAAMERIRYESVFGNR